MRLLIEQTAGPGVDLVLSLVKWLAVWIDLARLEMYEGKLSRTVLWEWRCNNASLLPGAFYAGAKEYKEIFGIIIVNSTKNKGVQYENRYSWCRSNDYCPC